MTHVITSHSPRIFACSLTLLLAACGGDDNKGTTVATDDTNSTGGASDSDPSTSAAASTGDETPTTSGASDSAGTGSTTNAVDPCAALKGFAEGRVIVIAPEGRYSVTGALEEGSGGAAFLAYKSGAAVLPIAITGTENEIVYGALKKFRRAAVHVKVGKIFKLTGQDEGRQEAIDSGTQQIMQALADLLPEKYRGAYSTN